MYEVYKHTFKETGKSYIGATRMGVYDRLKKHVQNAMRGSNTLLSKAIRKYGIENLTTEILYRTYSHEESREKEKYYIELYDTLNNGYNMTLGGDGGNCINKLSEENKNNWLNARIDNSKGEKNPKYSGYTDQEIIIFAVEYFKDIGKIVRTHWQNYCKTKGLPVNYSQFRFSGEGYEGFVKRLKSKLEELKIDYNDDNFRLTKEERYKKEYHEKISSSLKSNFMSDGEIIDKAVEYCKNKEKFVMKNWKKYCQENKIVSYYKNRFDKTGNYGFISALKKQLDELGIGYNDDKFPKLKECND